jgi:hypothetical protein
MRPERGPLAAGDNAPCCHLLFIFKVFDVFAGTVLILSAYFPLIQPPSNN